MKKFDYEQSNSDHTLFLKKKKDRITCLIICVDDIVITGNDAQEIRHLKQKLSMEFDTKDLDNPKYVLGIKVLRLKKGIFISKPVETSIMTNHWLQMIEGAKLADKDRYQRMVRKLIYLSHDIAYVVGVASRFMHMP